MQIAPLAPRRALELGIYRARDSHARAAVRGNVRSVDGMARIPNGEHLPWRADRPAIAVYDRLASDARLGEDIRADARAASSAVADLVLAHGESARFAPFGGASYRDAAGPTGAPSYVAQAGGSMGATRQ